MLPMRSKITKSVLGYFMAHEDAEMYVNEMSRRLGLDDGNLARKLKELEAEGILKSRELGHARYYSLNRAYPLLAEYRKIILKTVGIENSLREVLKKINGIEDAYVFGSYARDRMDVASDIDLLVVGDFDTVSLRKKLAGVQKTLDREINLVSMGRDEYARRRREDPLVKNIEKSKRIKII